MWDFFKSKFFIYILFFLIGIYSMQGWTATARDGILKKEGQKKIEAYRESFYKEPTVNRCLLVLDF